MVIFRWKKCYIFFIFAQNIDRGYTLEPEAVLTSTHDPCFRAKKRKNAYPGKPQFYYIKVGCKGMFITRTCYHDVRSAQVNNDKETLYKGVTMRRNNQYLSAKDSTAVGIVSSLMQAVHDWSLNAEISAFLLNQDELQSVKRLSHQAAFPLRCHGVVIFSRAPWERKKIMIFFVKNCLSRRPYSDQGVATELSWRSIAFLRCSWWRFFALSRCFHCVSTALTAPAPRFHGVATVLTPCWRRSFAKQNKVFVISCMFDLQVETMPAKRGRKRAVKGKCQTGAKIVSPPSPQEEAIPLPSPNQPRDESETSSLSLSRQKWKLRGSAMIAMAARWGRSEHLQERRAVSVQTPRTTTAFAQRPLCAPTELLLRCRRPYCAAMVTLRRPLCALLGRRANAERRCLFWVCSKCAPSLGVLCDPTVSNGDATALLWWCLRSYCAHLGVLQFLWTPWGRRPGVTCALKLVD